MAMVMKPPMPTSDEVHFPSLSDPLCFPFGFTQDLEKGAIKVIKELPNASEKVKAIAIRHHLETKKVLDNELEAKIKALQQEYELKFKPIYAVIAELANGERDAAPEENWKLDEILTEEEKKGLEAHRVKAPIKNYWTDALCNHVVVGSQVSDRDEKAMEYIRGVEYTLNDEDEEYSMIIKFAPNPFFTNEVLTCKSKYKKGVPCEIIGTEIAWKEGKNLTKQITTKVTSKSPIDEHISSFEALSLLFFETPTHSLRFPSSSLLLFLFDFWKKQTQKNKKTKQTKTITKEEDCDSFFNLFKSCSLSKDNEETEEMIANADEVIQAIIDEIVPYSLEYFLAIREGDAPPEGIEEEDEEYEDEEEEQAKKAPKKK